MNTPRANERSCVSYVGFVVFSWLLGVVLLLGIVLLSECKLNADEPKPKPSAGESESKSKANEKTELARLIEQLGDQEFVKREAAGRALEAVGEPALDALVKAAKSNKDPEIRHRAENVIQRIRARCFGCLRGCLPGHTGGVFAVACLPGLGEVTCSKMPT